MSVLVGSPVGVGGRGWKGVRVIVAGRLITNSGAVDSRGACDREARGMPAPCRARAAIPQPMAAREKKRNSEISRERLIARAARTANWQRRALYQSVSPKGKFAQVGEFSLNEPLKTYRSLTGALRGEEL